jgi:L-aminopeptidase/D-esterase-like protein
MIISIQGFKVGHYTNKEALTGCTVILCPPKTVGSCDIRGSAPGSRETPLLDPEKTMNQVHAILLTGGSAFGLSAAEGVMRYLVERDIGYETPWVKVPIVPAAVVFDLNVGDKNIRPTPDDAYAACVSATDGAIERGSVGAGTGTTVGKWMGMDCWMKGGIGVAELKYKDLIVSAIAVVNAVGDVYDKNGKVIAGARHPDGGFWADMDANERYGAVPLPLNTNTTLVVVATNAKLPKLDVYRMCRRSQTGMARAIKPVQTSHDGDCIFGLATGAVDCQIDLVSEIAAEVTADAIRDGVLQAEGMGNIPGIR